MRKTWLLLSVFALAGCDLGPGPVQPKISMPVAWEEQSPAPTAWPAADWWKAFGSAELNGLNARSHIPRNVTQASSAVIAPFS